MYQGFISGVSAPCHSSGLCINILKQSSSKVYKVKRGNLERKLDFGTQYLLLKEVSLEVRNNVCVGGSPVYSKN